MLNFRKLAAIDIVFLGYKFILVEYLCGVVLSIGIGGLTLWKGHSAWQGVVGVYLICLGIDYIPMVIYVLSIASRQQARIELGEELGRQREAMVKYRRLSVLLLVPFLVPIIAITRR